MQFYAPDEETVGRLRGLGRLLRITGEKLMDAAQVASTSWFDERFSINAASVYGCGSALRDAAVELLQGRWAEAGDLIGVARLQCGTFLPKEHLASLEALLGGSHGLPDARAALAALSSVLEVHAEGPSEAGAALKDALFEAAGSLRAAARLFAAPAAKPPRPAPAARRSGRRGSATGVAAAAVRAGVIPVLAQELEDTLADVPRGDMPRVLRELARKSHPDLHPHREAEVLPLFLHVQRLRVELRHRMF